MEAAAGMGAVATRAEDMLEVVTSAAGTRVVATLAGGMSAAGSVDPSVMLAVAFGVELVTLRWGGWQRLRVWA